MSTADTANTSRPITTGRRVGCLVGVLLLLHLVAGLMVPFILLHPLVGAQGFLVSAAEVANQTRVAVFLLFGGSALPIAVASSGWRVFREYSSAMALWLFALAVASFTLQNGGKLEIAQQMAGHESARTTNLYDRRNAVALDEIEKIAY